MSSPGTTPDLLKQLDGREVNGKTLQTAGQASSEIPWPPANRSSNCSGGPSDAVLMLVAIYGIIGELSNPGAILPGWSARSR